MAAQSRTCIQMNSKKTSHTLPSRASYAMSLEYLGKRHHIISWPHGILPPEDMQVFLNTTGTNHVIQTSIPQWMVTEILLPMYIMAITSCGSVPSQTGRTNYNCDYMVVLDRADRTSWSFKQSTSYQNISRQSYQIETEQEKWNKTKILR